MGSRAGLEAVEKRNIPCPCRELNPGRPARSLVAIPTSLVSICRLLVVERRSIDNILLCMSDFAHP
jgi:hypothetical protein